MPLCENYPNQFRTGVYTDFGAQIREHVDGAGAFGTQHLLWNLVLIETIFPACFRSKRYPKSVMTFPCSADLMNTKPADLAASISLQNFSLLADRFVDAYGYCFDDDDDS